MEEEGEAGNSRKEQGRGQRGSLESQAKANNFRHFKL